MFLSRCLRCVCVCAGAQNWYFLSSTISTANSRRRIPVNNCKQQINSLFKQLLRPAVCRWQTRLTPPTRNNLAKFQRSFPILFEILLAIFVYNVTSQFYRARAVLLRKIHSSVVGWMVTLLTVKTVQRIGVEESVVCWNDYIGKNWKPTWRFILNQ